MDNTPSAPQPSDDDPFDPGPMVHYPPLPLDQNGLPVPVALRQRIRDIRALHRAAGREFILRTLHSYLVAHRPMDEIARAFGVGVSRVYAWRKLLNQRMAAEFKQKTPIDLLVEQLEHFNHARAYSWRQASLATDHADKARWVNTALKAEASVSDLYTRIGMIDASTIQPTREEQEDTGGRAAALQAMAEQFLTGHFAKPKKKELPKSTEQDILGDGIVDDDDF